jgi:hypothetical protein
MHNLLREFGWDSLSDEQGSRDLGEPPLIQRRLGRVLIKAQMSALEVQAEILCSIGVLPVLTRSGPKRAVFTLIPRSYRPSEL